MTESNHTYSMLLAFRHIELGEVLSDISRPFLGLEGRGFQRPNEY
jgi:hypothetical protein